MTETLDFQLYIGGQQMLIDKQTLSDAESYAAIVDAASALLPAWDGSPAGLLDAISGEVERSVSAAEEKSGVTIAGCQATIASLEAKIVSHLAEIEQLKEKLEAATKAAEAVSMDAFSARVAEAATEMLAASGHKIPVPAVGARESQKTRRNMTAVQRLAEMWEGSIKL